MSTSSVVELAVGEFEIGDELIANASPSHRRRLARNLWLDCAPVSWAHFEVFVAGGGYHRGEFWTDDAGLPLPEPCSHGVDERCRELLALAEPTRRLFNRLPRRQQPLTGVTWYEARAIARFYGARLPFEVEWEVAHRYTSARQQAAGPVVTKRPATQAPAVQSQVVSHLGALQEWAADVFTPRYWRSDFDRPGVSWSTAAPDSPVVVRGAAPDDLEQNVCCRRGSAAVEGHPFRGFRRLWDAPPTANQTEARWQSFEYS